MTPSRRVALLTPDLMLRSRIVAALPGVDLANVASGDAAASDVEALFVDLNVEAAAHTEAIRRWRDAVPTVVIIGFCRHESNEVRRQAMAAGADRVVTNGSLAEEAVRFGERGQHNHV